MISIVCPEVHSFTLDFLDITWQVADTTELFSDYLLRVQRSESPQGPFDTISKPPLEGVFSFRDEHVDLFSKWRTWYYRVEAENKGSGEKGYSPVTYLGFKPDLVAMEVARLYQVLLQGEIGLPVVILKRRTSGPSCPFCYDAIRKRANDSNCQVCLGTTEYRGGFLDPIPTFMNESPSQKVLRISNISEMEPSDKSFDMSGYPRMVSGDVIVTPDNRRYRVVQVRNRSKRGFVHRQVIQASEIPRRDKVYNLLITPDMFPREDGELWPRPASFGPIEHDVRHQEVKGRWDDDFTEGGKV